MTGYSVFATRDYMRCVCDSWGQDVDDCLVAVEDPSDGNSALTVAFSTLFTTFFAMLSLI